MYREFVNALLQIKAHCKNSSYWSPFEYTRMKKKCWIEHRLPAYRPSTHKGAQIQCID